MKLEKLKFYVPALLLAMVAFTACSSDDPEPVNEEELITTLRVTFTGTGNTQGIVVATFKDLDGAGGDAPEITNPVTLAENGTYNVSVEFLNEAESPVENITEEVSEEADEHQIFFTASAGLNFFYEYTDQDSNGQPIGLQGIVSTGEAGIGTLQVLLIHEPLKTASSVSDGDPTNAGGETDISVSFNIAIQ